MRLSLDLEARPGRPIVLSSFLQPAAMPIESIEARQGGRPLPIARALDDKGFARFRIEGPPQAGPVTITYVVRPGAQEMAKMSGPTNFRFGWLDAAFGLAGARQLVLLPADPAPPDDIRVRLRPPADGEIVTTWPPPSAAGEHRFTGREAAAGLLQGVIGAGRFEEAASEDGSFRVLASRAVPDDLRAEALRRAIRLQGFLASALGRPRPCTVILVPRAPDGASISVAPGRGGFGLSLDRGLPTRWMTIARLIGQEALADRLAASPPEGPERRILASLPVFLGVELSERDGWRTRQAWYEQFYYSTAGLDLNEPITSAEALKREWRTALALHHLDRALVARGLGPLGDRLGAALSGGGPLRWRALVAKTIPRDLAQRLETWLAPGEYPFPFPGLADAGPPRAIPAPQPLPAAGAAARLDLYLGARNQGLLEQCGCRSRQMGGMARRATILRRRLGRGAPSLALELGDAVPWTQVSPVLDTQKVAESDLVFSLLAGAGVAGSVVSHAELTYGPAFLAQRVARLPRGFRLLSSNVRVPGVSLAPVIEARAGRVPVRVLGLMTPEEYDLGRALEYEDAIAAVRFDPPDEAAARLVGVAPAGALTIATGPLGPSSVLAILRAAPGLGLLVTSDYFHFNEDPRLRFEHEGDFATFGMIDGTLVAVLQSDAYALVRLGLALDGRGRVLGAELEPIPLDESIPDDPAVRRVLDAHYARLAATSGLHDVAPIGTRLRQRLDARYVGGAACAPCHDAESAQWQETAHAAAFATLLERRRQGVPACYACHVTGYRQPTGYRGIGDLGLRHVQCESCHGPGGRHVETADAGSIVRTPTAAVCMECHTPSHSDMTDENLPEYWSRIVHRPAAPAPAGR